MDRVQEGEEQGYGNSLDLVGLKEGDDGEKFGLVERLVYVPVGVNTFGDFETQVPGNDYLWRGLKNIVELCPGLASDFENVSESIGSDEGGAGAFGLQDGVGDYGGSVREEREGGRCDSVLGGEGLYGVYDGGRVVGGGGGHLKCRLPTGVLVDQSEVSKCSADVYAESKAHSWVRIS